MNQKIVQMDLPILDQKKEEVLFDAYLSSKMKKKFEQQALLNQNQEKLNQAMKVCITFLMHDMNIMEKSMEQMQNTIKRLCIET